MEIINAFSAYTMSTFGFMPRKSQIKAAKLLAYKDSLVHMDTGEGKTVVAALAALMTVHEGRRVYIVTVNDYLAKRDMEMFERLFASLGFTATLNTHTGDKNAIHSGNIIYTSVQNLLFDYVANEFKPDGLRFDLDMAILDEIDYVLLDSANTRYSVSMGDGCFKQDTMLLDAVWSLTDTLPQSGFTIEASKKRIALEEDAYEKIESVFSITPDMPKYIDVISLCQTALLAKYCYHNGIDYLVESDGVLSIINQYNGRASRNSFYEHELDYFLRKKENIRFAGMTGGLTNTMSAPILFRKFKTVVGMSGTTKQAREELGVLLGAGTQVIRPARRNMRVDTTLRFRAKDEKYNFIKEFIYENKKRYSYLVICEHEREACELYERFNIDLSVRLFTNQYIDIEQAITEEAGRAGNVLISTYLVGRGTDIVTDAECGLCAFVTHKNAESRSILQACGRAGRNGAKGRSFTLVSGEDEKALGGADLEAQRAISLCEDIIFENAKLSLMKWAEINGIKDYASYWLDFRNSLRGRIFLYRPDSFSGMVYSACELMKKEMGKLTWDIIMK